MNKEQGLKYKRILFKVSGEALMGDEKFGHDNDASLSIDENSFLKKGRA